MILNQMKLNQQIFLAVFTFILNVTLGIGAHAETNPLSDFQRAEVAAYLVTTGPTWGDVVKHMGGPSEVREEILSYLVKHELDHRKTPDVAASGNRISISGAFRPTSEFTIELTPKPRLNFKGRIVELTGSFEQNVAKVRAVLNENRSTARHRFWNALWLTSAQADDDSGVSEAIVASEYNNVSDKDVKASVENLATLGYTYHCNEKHQLDSIQSRHWYFEIAPGRRPPSAKPEDLIVAITRKYTAKSTNNYCTLTMNMSTDQPTPKSEPCPANGNPHPSQDYALHNLDPSVPFLIFFRACGMNIEGSLTGGPAKSARPPSQ